jgi:hypothetical protein
MNRLFLSILIVLLAAAPFAGGQSPAQLAVPNSPAYEKAAESLRSAPARQYDFSKAMMVDVMRVMAEDAGISFFGLPEGASGAERLVTFSINASPFSALETLSKANGISLIHENGIWYIRPADDSELVGRIYQINYNAQELVKKNDQGGGSTSSSSGGSSGGGSGTGNIGLNLQGQPDFFVTEPSRLLEDIKGILDIQTTGRNATFAPTGSVDTMGQLSLGGLQGQPDVFVRTGANGNRQGGTEATNGSGNQAKVIWNSDSNSLYVVATRQQHQWVEGYIATADQPQPMVAVEVKFLEMNKNPQSELGIDWTGALGGGYGAGVSGLETLSIDPDTGIADFAGTEDGQVNSLLNLDRVGDYSLPMAILSYDEVNLKLRALFNDRKNRSVSYPRMLTLDNREVSFRSVRNIPVLSSQASTSLGAGATETNSVEYVPIGTVINILPKRMNDGKVLLNVSLTVSDIVGTEVINGNPYPIASSRVYTAPITVESGYTVAISGLDAAEDDRNEAGVPLLGKIPVIKWAFKYDDEKRSRQHLMMLITPTLIGDRHPGVNERPTIRSPWGHPEPPAFSPFGPDPSPTLPDPPQTAALPPVAPVAPSFSNSGAPGGQIPSPMIAEAAPVQAPKKNGLFERIFKKKNPTAPANDGFGGADYEEGRTVTPVTAPGAPAWGESTPANSSVSIAEMRRSGSATPLSPSASAKPVSKPGAAPAQLAAAPAMPQPTQVAPAPAIAAANGIRWDGGKLAGGAQSIPGAVGYLQKELQTNPAKANEIAAQTHRLLDYMNELRDEGTLTVGGEYSDDWWTLIKLKTQANAAARASGAALVDGKAEEN